MAKNSTKNQRRLPVLVKWLSLILWPALIFYLSSIPELKSGLPLFWDLIFRKLAHITEYLILFFLWFQVLDLPFKRRLVLAFIFSLLYAVSDEYHQSFIFGREGCLRDVGIDSLGILAGYFIMNK
ncbi:hypothetical protein COS23_00665 [bacterium (Candidatus Moisslbacteria) CG02_land_8_20_14_3_00_36_53]|nr:MAG: hypothetical protein COS23_00665 [bacterium (Candidatus Moisslbacteria) CG02_land_8_20_14_3_00_36_53]